MDAARLVEGYRSRDETHLSPTRHTTSASSLLLSRCHPYRRRLTYANLRAFVSSLVRQGIISRGRFSYWKFMLTAALATAAPSAWP